MSIHLFAQVILLAVMMSVSYSLIAVGLSVIFSVLNVVNFAHGEFYMLGAYLAYVLSGAVGAGYWWWFPLVIAGGVILGAIVEKAVFSPLRNDILGGLIASFGLGFVLQEAAVAVWGAEDKVVPPIVTGTFEVGPAFVPYDRLLIFIFGTILIGLVLIIVHFSKTGRAIRAVAQDRDAAALQGISVNWVRLVAFMLGTTLALSAGFILSPLSYNNPYMGGDYILKAFIIIIIGGLGSIYGAIAGAVLLAFIDAFGTVLVGIWSPLVGFLLLALVLLFRPYGLMGKEEREETK